MSRQSFMSYALVAGVYWATTGAANAQPTKTDDDLLQSLDPLIVNAVKLNPTDTPLRKLEKARCRERAIALARFQAQIGIAKWNQATFSESLKVFNPLTENLLELITTPADQVRCYELRVEFLKSVEQFVTERVKESQSSPFRSDLAQGQHLNLARAARIDAEIELLRFKAQIDKAKK